MAVAQRLVPILRRLDRRAPSNLRRVARDVARQIHWPGAGARLVSVVVTASDEDADYLDEALASAARQTHSALEIVVVLHGESAQAADVVRRRMRADHRFRMLRRPSLDQAGARDAGVGEVHGRFLCFLQGHDLLPATAVGSGYAALSGSGSDFAVGRSTDLPTLLPSVLRRVDRVHDMERLQSTLIDFPMAITDTALGNRLFRTAFWQEAGLSFAGARGDGELILTAYRRARRFDILTAATYSPQNRAHGTPVEQLYDSTADLMNWVVDAEATHRQLQQFGEVLCRHWVLGLFEQQFQTFLDDVERMTDAHWQTLRDLGARLRADLDAGMWCQVRTEARVKVGFLLNDRRDELADFVAARWFERDNVQTRVVDGRVHAMLPYYDDAAAGLDPDDFVLADAETPARVQLRSVRPVNSDLVTVDLLAFVQLIDLSGRVPEITARLVPGETIDGHPVALVPVSTPRIDEQANVTIGHKHQDYRPGGCTARIDIAALPLGQWHLEVTVSVAGLTRTTDIVELDRRGAAGLLGTRYQPVQLTSAGTAVGISSSKNRLAFTVRPAPPVTLTDASVAGRTVRLSLTATDPAALTAVRARRGATVAEAAVVGGIARLELPERLAEDPNAWKLRAVIAGVEEPVGMRGTDAESWIGAGEDSLVVDRTEYGNAILVESADTAIIDRVDLDDGVARVRGRWLGAPAAGAKMFLAGAGPRASAVVNATQDGGFVVDLPIRWNRWGLGETRIPRREYRFGLELPSPGAETRSGRMMAGQSFIDQLLVFQLCDEVKLRPTCRRSGEPGIALSMPIPVAHTGAYPQEQLHLACLAGMGPIDPKVVYLSTYDGAAATDSGRAIHDVIRRTRPDLTVYWGVADPSAVPAGGRPVVINTPEWYRVISTAGHLVQNVDFPRWWRKRQGQRFLQTFHGYPAKSMGLRMWRAKNFTPRRLQIELDRTMAGWDLILTPAPEMDVYYRAEYAYQGKIHNQGYPRDDALLQPSADAVRRRTRELLGIRPDQTAVLYAPTWRDHLASSYQSASMVEHLDVASASAALGDDYVILLRGHRFNTRGRARDRNAARVLDVTEYPEINDLILAADAAVLDYSSLRFDFALTGRPMIFLVPDLAEYTGGIRGFLFDYADTAPGPLLETAAEVIEALTDVEALAEAYRDEIAQFVAKYQYLQDGRAAERVVAEFFGPMPTSG